MSDVILLVTKERFYAALYADKRDIMPSIVSGWSDETGYTQEWRTQDTRSDLFGVTTGGAAPTYRLSLIR